MMAHAPRPGMRRATTLRTGRLHIFGRPDHLQPPPVTVAVERWEPSLVAEGFYPVGHPLDLRQRVENVIESLIDLLDAIDGDGDVETGTDDDGCQAEDLKPMGDGMAGDRDDAEEETDMGAAEDEGCAAFATYYPRGAGCPVFEGF